MLIDFFAIQDVHPLGDTATAPIAPPWSSLAALLVVAGTSLLPPRAYPGYPMTAHSALSNCRFQDDAAPAAAQVLQ